MTRMLLAEFRSPAELATALRALGDLGYQKLDAHTPYSTAEVRDALGVRRSRLPTFVLVGGILGASGAYFLQWLTVAYLYPLNVGGRPRHMPLAFVPITFEMGVLLAAFFAFFGVLFLGRLLCLWHPVFEVEGFQSASIDKFWLRVEGSDPRYDAEKLRSALEPFGPSRIALLGEEPS